MGLLPLETGGEGYHAPSPDDFNLPPLFPDVPWLAWLDKYMLQAIVATILIIIFWLVMARKRQMVPGKSQFIGETAYFFVRNSIARDNLGHDFRKFLPWLIALFSFILINNLWGIFPLHADAHHGARRLGLRSGDHGLGHLQRGRHRQARLRWLPQAGHAARRCAGLHVVADHPAGVLLQHHRPAVTLALRLFANMFAGHLLVLVFVLGGEYLLLESEGIVNNIAGGVSLVFSMAIFALEVFVQCLQAFIFTVLTAVYLSSSLADEH